MRTIIDSWETMITKMEAHYEKFKAEEKVRRVTKHAEKWGWTLRLYQKPSKIKRNRGNLIEWNWYGKF